MKGTSMAPSRLSLEAAHFLSLPDILKVKLAATVMRAMPLHDNDDPWCSGAMTEATEVLMEAGFRGTVFLFLS